jgi:HK97 family phage prohead protease
MSATRFFSGGAEALSDTEVLVCASTEQLARDGHVIVQAGLDLTNYRKNPIVLFQHQPDCPVATATAIGFDGDKLVAKIEFAPIGVSQLADQVRALVKSGVLKGVSIGFDPKETEPLDKAKPRGGQRITKSELLEISFVSIPADVGAGVTARWYGTRADMLATLHRLPVIPAAAVQRAAAGISGARRGRLLDHTTQTYLLVEANRQREADREKRYSFAQRQADLRELGSKNGGGVGTH